MFDHDKYLINTTELYIFMLSKSWYMVLLLFWQTEVIVDARVVRKGRNLTIVAVDFKVKLKKTEQLVYQARSTFYDMPVAKLWTFVVPGI